MGNAWSKVKGKFSPQTSDNYRLARERETPVSAPVYTEHVRPFFVEDEVRAEPNALPQEDTLPRQNQNGGVDRATVENRTEQINGRHDPEEEMILQLSCPICLDLYTDAVILPCLHSLCWECANNLWERVNPFMCPECKEPVGREKLKRNFPLNNLVQIYKRDIEARERNNKRKEDQPSISNAHSSNKKNTFVQPKSCATCQNAPNVFCLQCTMAFCNSCLVDYHPTVETTPEHQLQPVLQQDPIVRSCDSNVQIGLQTGLQTFGNTLDRVNAEFLQRFVSSGRMTFE